MTPSRLMQRLTAGIIVLAMFLPASGRSVEEAALPKLAPSPEQGYMLPQARERLKNLALHSIEGIWQLMPEGATVCIERTDAKGIYRMMAIESDCREVLPGTLLGIISSGGDATTYDLRLYSSIINGRLTRPKRFTVRLSAGEGRMEFLQHRSSLRISLWHFVPFLWRHSVRYAPDEKDYYPGAVRVLPRPNQPIHPRPL